LVISDNILQEKVASVHEMKGIEGKEPCTSPPVPVEVVGMTDASVWTDHNCLLSESPLVGKYLCASERNIMMKAYDEFWMASRSSNGLIFQSYIRA
jgi:hypothetical protein